jgi:hypothetical protein
MGSHAVSAIGDFTMPGVQRDEESRHPCWVSAADRLRDEDDRIGLREHGDRRLLSINQIAVAARSRGGADEGDVRAGLRLGQPGGNIGFPRDESARPLLAHDISRVPGDEAAHQR